jgi:glycosyl transferase family 92
VGTGLSGASGPFLEYAARARANPHFDLEERAHRVDIAQRMHGMLVAAHEGSLVLRGAVATVFRGHFGGRQFSLTEGPQNQWLQAWAVADGPSLTKGLVGFVEGDHGPEERFASFARAAEEAAGAGKIELDPGAVLALGSLFNFSVEALALPVISVPLYERLEGLLGSELAPDASLDEQYAHHLAFTRRLREEMEASGIPIRDMVDAQSLIWVAAEEAEIWAPDSPATDRAARERPETYLSMCAIYRDEGPYLREWIEFHRLVGVERFYLYNDRSRDDHLAVLEPYIERGIVVLHDWNAFPAPQGSAYEHCLAEYGDQSRWIAFIDLDEFLFSPSFQSLPEVLAELEDSPGVGVNSVFYGTSGYRTRPAGLVIENYLENDAGEGKRAIKSIVDPTRTASCLSVHHFSYHDGMAVNEHGYPIPAQFTKSVSHSRLRINHYWARSEEQFRAKLASPMPATGTFRAWYDTRRLRGGRVNELSYEILKHAPALHEALEGVPVTRQGGGSED